MRPYELAEDTPLGSVSCRRKNIGTLRMNVWAGLRLPSPDNERDIFLQMAQVWLEAAMRSEDGPTKVHRARHDVITRLAG